MSAYAMVVVVEAESADVAHGRVAPLGPIAPLGHGALDGCVFVGEPWMVKPTSVCPVCGAEGEESCEEEGGLIDDHGERGGDPQFDTRLCIDQRPWP